MAFQFVVMEHHADRAGLHFDLRFRIPGSMKWASFAVRKGIPLEPGTKVLAVRTEDHTEHEALFTGNIRNGYGKGKLIKWDSGFCEVEKYSLDRIILNFRGKKVKGLYYMIKVGSDQKSNKPTYLLFKGNLVKENYENDEAGMNSRVPPNMTQEEEMTDQQADKEQDKNLDWSDDSQNIENDNEFKPLPWNKGGNNVVNKITVKEVRTLVELEEVSLLVDNEEMTNIHKAIMNFFAKNPDPKDDEIHALADKLNLDPHSFETHIYMVLGSILGAGKSKDFTGSYDPEQIKMGIEVEKEHTTNPDIAERIAKDHLAEIPDYYTRLKKMESEAGVKD